MDDGELDLISCAADIVSAYVAHHAIGADKLPELIGSVYAALSKASVQGVEPEKPELTPAISVTKSVTPDYIVCLDDGKKFKSLKRHLRTHYDMSPEEYRAKWGLRAIIPWLHRPMPSPVRTWPKAWDWASATERKRRGKPNWRHLPSLQKRRRRTVKAERGSSGRRSALAVSGAARVSGGLGALRQFLLRPVIY